MSITFLEKIAKIIIDIPYHQWVVGIGGYILSVQLISSFSVIYVNKYQAMMEREISRTIHDNIRLLTFPVYSLNVLPGYSRGISGGFQIEGREQVPARMGHCYPGPA